MRLKFVFTRWNERFENDLRFHPVFVFFFLTALISTVAEFGGMMSNLVLPYYVSKKHPIRTVSCGMYMIGAACFIKVLPHHFSEMGSEVKKYTREFDDKSSHDTGTAVASA